MRFMLAVLPLIALSACAPPTNQPLVSAQFPPGTAAHSEPQPLTSLPPGAANLSSAAGATSPNYASVKLRAF
jgi:hypothetical protein